MNLHPDGQETPRAGEFCHPDDNDQSSRDFHDNAGNNHDDQRAHHPGNAGDHDPPPSSTDTAPPVTTVSLAGTSDGGEGFRPDVTVTLSASDNAGGSGISITQYSFDGTSWFTYSRPVSIMKPGMTTHYYRSTDKAGNTELAKVKAVVISAPGTEPAGTGTVQQAATAPVNATQQPPATAAAKTPWPSAALTVTVFAGAALLLTRGKP